ncbi:hypothetical protein [Vibrio crassostreae]|uniref:hypothetical protein n=1 Tax=Vibrio crassostreae TaxID=246167 RepID=UPI003CE51AFF
MSNLESRISNLESRISNLESRISNLESRISNLESRISNLESIYKCTACLSSYLLSLKALQVFLHVSLG